MTKRSKIWKNNISFPSKIRLYKFIAVSILHCGFDSWTLTPETTKKTQDVVSKCFRRFLIIWTDLLGPQADNCTNKSTEVLVTRRGKRWHGTAMSDTNTLVRQSCKAVSKVADIEACKGISGWTPYHILALYSCEWRAFALSLLFVYDVTCLMANNTELFVLRNYKCIEQLHNNLVKPACE